MNSRTAAIRAGVISCAAGMVLSVATTPAKSDDKAAILAYADEAILATILPIHVEVQDNVTGGCFTNRDSVKTAVELVLRRNGIKVVDASNHFIKVSDKIVIRVSGQRIELSGGHAIGCYVFIETAFGGPRAMELPFGSGTTLARYTREIGTRAVWGPSSLNDTIRTAATENAEAFANDVLRAREIIADKAPNLIRQPGASETEPQ